MWLVLSAHCSFLISTGAQLNLGVFLQVQHRIPSWESRLLLHHAGPLPDLDQLLKSPANEGIGSYNHLIHVVGCVFGVSESQSCPKA